MGINEKFGIVGFEPTTFCSQSRRATKLRYIPIVTQNLCILQNWNIEP